MATSLSHLTALVVAHNEALHLPACLASLQFADRLIVVLDRCTDASQAIAQAAGATVLSGDFANEGERRNFARSQCPDGWILEVDADERISQSLAEEVRTIVDQSTADYHPIPVDNYIGRQCVRNGWGGSFGVRTVTRLSRKEAKTWGNQQVHPRVTYNGVEGAKLKHPIIHLVDDDLSDTLQRLNRYSDLRARDLVQHGHSETLGKNIGRLFSRFFKCYVMRKGYREGLYGFVIALCAGLYPLLSYVKATCEPHRFKDPSCK